MVYVLYIVTKINMRIYIMLQCVDYWRLNATSQTNAYPMPRIDDLIDQLGHAQFLSTLDLTRGYWQVPMGRGSCHKTAFVTPSGQFQFTVMPFGLSGAPSTFQQMITKDTRDFAAAYLDDLIVYSDRTTYSISRSSYSNFVKPI